jgi:chromosome segregation ATPase
MSADLPHQVLLLAVGAFLLGWILASISARISGRYAARKRDPRDDRIRSLEAEHRVSQVSTESLRSKIESSNKELQAAREETAMRDGVIRTQQIEIDKLTSDLRDSVRKTRELRQELQDRATENQRSEAKQRELETELSIAQASTDLIATGVLDYSFADDEDEGRAAAGRRAPGSAR